ncbi:MAG: TraR/DksA family transcriptional regulator [Spirochaetales bacterium]|nr:TraR/DksA family transcriptional regulator [Spirochaetales bacterium]
MDKQFVDEMEQKLFEMKEEIIRKFMSEDEDFKQLVSDMSIKDLGDVASDDIDKRQMEALNQHEVKRLRLIDSAISRIKNQRYGKCLSCGKKIPQERLRAIPYALLCIECKNGEEKSSRRA